MSLPTIKLDDRHFQDIVDEAKKRIGQQYPDWSDHNVSDPGIMLVELFAWMTEMILYRLNQVPQQAAITFLDTMLGVKRHGPQPAKTPVTFWLTKPLADSLVIPAATEVASTRTSTQDSVVFLTDKDAKIMAAQLVQIGSYSRRSDQYRPLDLQRFQKGKELLTPLGIPEATEGDALYLGFASDLSGHILELQIGIKQKGAGYLADYNPFIWEAFTTNPQPWQPCDLIEDTTQSMLKNGHVQLHIPLNLKQGTPKTVSDDDSLFWLRVRLGPIASIEKEAGVQKRSSPQIDKLGAKTWGVTTAATQGRLVKNELVGTSAGTAGQRFHLKHKPILPRWPNEILVSRVGDGPVQVWQEVVDFAEATKDQPCYKLDEVTGEICFGPALRQPDGSFRQYGAIPANGAKLYFKQYRYGGGVEGNVPVDRLNTLKTSIPGIGRVHNRYVASGGLNAENLEMAVMRGLQEMRMGLRSTAVTANDFEFLACHLLREHGVSARVKCLSPGRTSSSVAVRLIVVKNVAQSDDMPSIKDLELTVEEQDLVRAELENKMLLTTRLVLVPFTLYRVAFHIELSPTALINPAEVERRLYRFLNPVAVPDYAANNLPLRQKLQIADVYRLLHDIPVESIAMYEADQKTGQSLAGSRPTFEVALTDETGIIVSGRHQVTFAPNR